MERTQGRTRHLIQLASAGLGTLALGVILGAAAVGPATATATHRHGKPSWVHVERIHHRHHGARCAVVWGGNGGTSALVCRDGFLDPS